MAVLTYSQISDLVLDRVQANTATDAPISATEMARFINDAFAMVWEISGGSLKSVASATAWTPAQTVDTTGKLTGILTDIDEIMHCWATATSGSTGGGSSDYELDRVELHRIEFLRRNQGLGTYAVPKLYAVTRLTTVTPADVNKVRLDFYPGVSGLYFPIAYVPQFTPIDSVTVTTPDVNDLESRDIALIAAMRFAPLLGRAELVPAIAMDVSEATQKALERKWSALMQGKQDDARPLPV